MEPITIITGLLELWKKYPEIRETIDRIRKGEGISDAVWQERLTLLGQHSSTYFDSAPPKPPAPPEPPGPAYDVIFEGEYPGDAHAVSLGYRAGEDYVHVREIPPAWGVRNANFLPFGPEFTSHKLTG